jgi:hypothetical protein
MRRTLIALTTVLVTAGMASATDFHSSGFSFPMFESTGGAFNPDTGTLWFHEHYQGVMHEYNVNGTPTGTVVPTPGDPDMHGLGYNPITGNYWASEAIGQAVIEFTPTGAPVSQFTAATTDQCGLTVNDNTQNLYWTSWTYGAIIEYTPQGGIVSQFGSTNSPLSLDYLPCTDTILLSNDNGSVLQELSTTGTVIASWSIPTLLGVPSVRIRAMGYDTLNGYLYLANAYDQRVYEVQDLDFNPSPVQASSWGGMKSMFR